MGAEALFVMNKKTLKIALGIQKLSMIALFRVLRIIKTVFNFKLFSCRGIVIQLSAEIRFHSFNMDSLPSYFRNT